MKLLDQEQEIRKQIFEYFSYKEDYRVLPFSDCRSYAWKIISEGRGGVVRFGDLDLTDDDDMDYFEDEIYTQRFLDKWVYRGEEFTMILVDTHTDGNQFLSIFTNSKEVK